MLNARSKEDIEFCMQMFNCPSVDLTVAKRKVNFLTKCCNNGTILLRHDITQHWVGAILEEEEEEEEEETRYVLYLENRNRSKLDEIGLKFLTLLRIN